MSILILILFRGWLYRATISYTPVGERTNISLTDVELQSAVKNEITDKTLSLKNIANVANKLTLIKLKFTTASASSNPNEVAKSGKANCVGYAALFNSIVQFIISENESAKKYEAKHLIGKMDLLGFDLHRLFSDPFFRDHDYNQIKNLETGETIWVDPSVSDYLGIKQVRSTPF